MTNEQQAQLIAAQAQRITALRDALDAAATNAMAGNGIDGSREALRLDDRAAEAQDRLAGQAGQEQGKGKEGA
jgi:hypothetical protein